MPQVEKGFLAEGKWTNVLDRRCRAIHDDPKEKKWYRGYSDTRSPYYAGSQCPWAGRHHRVGDDPRDADGCFVRGYGLLQARFRGDGDAPISWSLVQLVFVRGTPRCTWPAWTSRLRFLEFKVFQEGQRGGPDMASQLKELL